MSKVIKTDTYRITEKKVSLSSFAADETNGVDPVWAKQRFKKNRRKIRELQQKLYAESSQSLLIVFQAMDTGGKDSTIRKLTRGINPQGCRVSSFKTPSKLELAHDFLWRAHATTPKKGFIEIYNRSHYEDVLIVKVHGWASTKLTNRRYRHINDFERLLVDHGTCIVKIMLNISKDYQLERLRLRLEDPDKHWKFNPNDLKERKHWHLYMKAYEQVLVRCSKKYAPWYVVPAENRWYRDLIVSQIVLDALQRMNPEYPEPGFNLKDYPPESLS